MDAAVVWERGGDYGLDQELYDAFVGLGPAAARELARRAVDLLASQDDDDVAGWQTTLQLLLRLSALYPDVLEGLHGRLVDLAIYEDAGMEPYRLFHRADAASRDRLLALLGASPSSSDPTSLVTALLASLAWVDDDTVRESFRAWISTPPAWVPDSRSDRANRWLSFFPTYAGWTIARSGERRSLHRPGGACLIPAAAYAGGDVPGTSVGGADAGHCHWCDAGLTVLFDLALDDERLAFLGLSGSRLRVLTCELCVCYGPVLMDVDLAGGATWFETNVRPDYLPSDAGRPDTLPDATRVLGRPLLSPLEPLAFPNDLESSYLAGHPTWVQDAEYPRCPRCGEFMPFVGQVDTSVVAWGEGTIYAFHDASCNLTATTYQQT